MAIVMPGLERRLKAELSGDVGFDRFTRGRYATDASHYQVTPVGVVAPRTIEEAERAIEIARTEGVSVLARGGGTSQAGQTVGDSLVVDCSKYLTRILDLDVKRARCTVEPGIVLDDLNRQLKGHGLWFPVDISTASRATIGGMAANNSCGGRSMRYGTMRDNVVSIEAVLADGTLANFGPLGGNIEDVPAPLRPLAQDLLAIGAREAGEIEARFPKVQRRVGGYNLDALVPGRNDINLSHILVGSEGTLAFSTRIELALSPLLPRRTVGAVHFGSFYEAMNAAQHIVRLNPIAVELIDRTMIELARAIPIFRPTLDKFVRGMPEAVLLVEFGDDDYGDNLQNLMNLKELIGELGFGWDRPGDKWGGVVEVVDAALQAAIAEVRTSGLNIMMSMKEEGKPVSFVEDCAVPLEHLAEYTSRLTAIFDKHGTRGTWYAHAGSGCLHVRPVLNLRQDKDVHAMRAIAEEAFAMVREYKGSHSGEHGDGLVRSEFNEPMFGSRLARAFEEVKDRFDPKALFNPGKVVRPPKFDDRTLFRYAPGYHGEPIETHLDWSAYPGVGGGFQGAVEMCNNNGACRKLSGGAMCPSYRVTRDERDVTRGRANTLRLALSGQLGPDALASDEMAETLQLCVSCKACRRECPTGVDMARMKIEVQAARAAKRGLTLHDRLVGWLPRYAPYAAQRPWLFNLRNGSEMLRQASELFAGFSRRRSLPQWRADIYQDRSDWAYAAAAAGDASRDVVLFADTFNRYFERENLDAALRVLVAGGYRVHALLPTDGDARPLCCGRTFLSVGQIAEAKREMERTLSALAPYVARGVPVIGLEPSCLFTFRDEMPALIKNETVDKLAGQRAAAGGIPGARAGRRPAQSAARSLETQSAAARPLPPEGVRRHGRGREHVEAGARACRRDRRVELLRHGRRLRLRRRIPSMSRSRWASCRCCRRCAKSAADTLIVADGTSCRHQIHDGAERDALHVARVLAMSLAEANGKADSRVQ